MPKTTIIISFIFALAGLVSEHSNASLIPNMFDQEDTGYDCLSFHGTSPYENDTSVSFSDIPLHIDKSEGFINMGVYMVGIDGFDDDDNDGIKDVLGVPKWTVQAITNASGITSAPNPPISLYEHSGFNRLFDFREPGSVSFSDLFSELNSDHTFTSLVSPFLLSEYGNEQACNGYFGFASVPASNAFKNGLWRLSDLLIRRMSELSERTWIMSGAVFRNKIRYIKNQTKAQLAMPDSIFRVIVSEKGVTTQVYVLLLPLNAQGLAQVDMDLCPKTLTNTLSSFLISPKTLDQITGMNIFDTIRSKQKTFKYDDPNDFNSGIQQISENGCDL